MDLIELKNKYKKIYLLGYSSRTSKEIQKRLCDAQIEADEIWDDKWDRNRAENTVAVPQDLSQIKEGLVILAPEMRYLEKWNEKCSKDLGTDYIDGYELIYSDLYEHCRQSEDGNIPVKCINCKASYHSCPVRREYFEKKGEKRSKVIRNLAFKAGFICNLKCKYCCEYLPYFEDKHRITFAVDEYKNDIKKITDACEYLRTLSFSGGDVMLNPGLSELMDYVAGIENIGEIYILTNGTYIPSDQILKALERNSDRIRIVINDYEINGKAEKLLNILKSIGVECKLRPNDGWFDLTDIKKRGRSVEELKDLYETCEFDRNDNSYFIYCNGVINMRCGVANGIMHYLDLYDECREFYVDVRNTDTSDLVNKLIDIEKRGYVKMCDYCSGCKPVERVLQPAAMQIKKND